MESSTPLIRVVTEAMYLGAYRTQAWAEAKLILFLAKVDGTWTVGGRFPSVESETLWRVDMPRRTFYRTMQALTEVRVVTVAKVGRSTIYALSQAFLTWCNTLYEARNDQALISQLLSAKSGTEWVPSVALQGAKSGTPHIEDRKETRTETTAEAGRPDGRPEEDTMSDTPNDGFYDSPKQARGWGGKSEGTPLGGEQSVAPPKAVKHSPPRGKDVLAVKAYFQSKLLAFSEARHVPLWESVGKMHNNIQFLLKQEHSQDTLERAIDFFASQAPSMMFQGTSLWDQFFAHREEALKFAAVAGIGTRGAPREDPMALSRRLSQHQREQRSK